MINRREFLRNGFRGLLLGGLAVMSGTLILRNYGGEEASCDFDFLCQGCDKLKACRLPEGEKFRTKVSK
ncbi:hypothetical protein [Labilibaculum antarcticum]|uniref:Uncharacterized protein n=1 Tax=Labilibaculum antarcticum TaxID=1717717 RepID=A0A1Y1CQ62_9BACT|nr:hypothetical protein [Labilibaculum antarcticum]BAX82113.1 hypothetical protein ALGA_3821 [Labilibaculum antarcticum]